MAYNNDIKQLVYGKQVLISTFIFYPVLLALSCFYIIFGLTYNYEFLVFRIIFIAFGLLMLGISVWAILGIIRHRAVTASLTIDRDGISYKSKNKYYLSWEQIHRIEIMLFRFHYKQMPKPYIVFYTNYGNQKKFPLTADKISEDFIFTYYTWKLHKYIENQVGRTLIENCKTPKRFRNREYRKRNREMNKIWRNCTLDK